MLQPVNDGFQGEVLIVDDSFLDLRFLSEILNDHNYQVRRANCSATALRALDTWPPDIILLDINMPGVSGYDLCKQLKENPRTADIPVIFISASDEGLDKQTAFTVGGSDYIEKPFQAEEVIVRVQNQLKVRWATEALKEKNHHLEKTLQELKETQTLIIEAERISTLGQIVRNIAAEIKMPMALIGANIQHINQCCDNMLDLLRLYDKLRQSSDFLFAEAQHKNQLDMFKSDVIDISRLLTLTESEAIHVKTVADSINNLFSPEDAELKSVDINQIIESVISILRGRLNRSKQSSINLVKEMEVLPKIVCYANQLSQALFITMNNALDAIQEQYGSHGNSSNTVPIFKISTQLIRKDTIQIAIYHNGVPPTELLKKKAQKNDYTIWDFQDSLYEIENNKPDLGIFICYQIIVGKHHGQMRHYQRENGCTEFVMELPVIPNTASKPMVPAIN